MVGQLRLATFFLIVYLFWKQQREKYCYLELDLSVGHFLLCFGMCVIGVLLFLGNHPDRREF